MKYLSVTVSEKSTVDLHNDLPKIKVKYLDDFCAAYYSLIIRFSGKYFLKLNEPSSKIAITRFGEFIINPKKENQFD